MGVLMHKAELSAYLDKIFPEINMDGPAYSIVAVDDAEAIVQLVAGPRHLRPGGTVSGPTLMSLADYAAYVVILAHIGPVELAVTTNLNINFLRKPAPGNLLATCRLLKLGKRLAVTECQIRSAGADDVVAHATATYSIPPS